MPEPGRGLRPPPRLWGGFGFDNALPGLYVYIVITTRSRYALRAMIDIARHGGEKPVTTVAVAERQGVSAGYLERIVRGLAEAGLLSSRRGPGGGYRLARDPEDIRLIDIVRAGGETVVSVPCACEDCGDECPLADDCPARQVWTGLNDVVGDYLERRTLDELVVEDRRAGDKKTKNGLRPLRSAVGSD